MTSRSSRQKRERTIRYFLCLTRLLDQAVKTQYNYFSGHLSSTERANL